MEKLKEMGVKVTIHGRHVKLVQNPALEGLDCCDHCALLGDPCGATGCANLTSLCCIDGNKANTYFVEVPGNIEVHGINNQEITISALSALRDAEKKLGNHSRAKIAQKLIDQIG